MPAGYPRRILPFPPFSHILTPPIPYPSPPPPRPLSFYSFSSAWISCFVKQAFWPWLAHLQRWIEAEQYTRPWLLMNIPTTEITGIPWLCLLFLRRGWKRTAVRPSCPCLSDCLSVCLSVYPSSFSSIKPPVPPVPLSISMFHVRYWLVEMSESGLDLLFFTFPPFPLFLFCFFLFSSSSSSFFLSFFLFFFFPSFNLDESIRRRRTTSNLAKVHREVRYELRLIL